MEDWSPLVTGFSGTPTVVAKTSVIGKMRTIFISASGTSNSSTKEFSLPSVPAAWQNNAFSSPATTTEASTYIGATLIDSVNSMIKVYRGFNQATPTSMVTPWSTSGSVGYTVILTYEEA